MRIALLSYRSKPHGGGQGVYVRHLSRELAALGHRADAKLDYAVVADAGAWDDLSSAQSALLPTAIPSRIIELLRGTP